MKPTASAGYVAAAVPTAIPVTPRQPNPSIDLEACAPCFGLLLCRADWTPAGTPFALGPSHRRNCLRGASDARTTPQLFCGVVGESNCFTSCSEDTRNPKYWVVVARLAPRSIDQSNRLALSTIPTQNSTKQQMLDSEEILSPSQQQAAAAAAAANTTKAAKRFPRVASWSALLPRVGSFSSLSAATPSGAAAGAAAAAGGRGRGGDGRSAAVRGC
jgi:hypothetical protein